MNRSFSRKTNIVFTLLILLTGAAHVDSSPTTDIESLKRDNAELKSKVEALERQQTLEIKKIHSAVERTDRSSKKRNESIKRSIKTASDRLQMSGYLSAGVTMAEDNMGSTKLNFKDKPNFRTDSVVGLQYTYNVVDNTQGVVQLIAQGYDDWQVNAEWAYVIYKFRDDLKFRAGRLRIPFYFESENLDVGFSYPWVRPPVEFYFLEIRSFEGIDMLYHFETGEVIHDLQILTGSFNETILGNDITGKDAGGINISSQYRDFTFRLAWHQVDVSTSLELGSATINISDKATYTSTGIKYDNNRDFVMAEYSYLTGKESTFTQDTEYGVITLGRWYGNFLPYIYYAYIRSLNDNDFLGYGTCCIFTERVHFDLPPFAVSNYSLGLRYNVSAKTALKIEISHIFDPEPRNGIPDLVFSGGAPSDGLALYDANDEKNSFGDSGTIYSMVFDMVF